jgi:hypothetical protein
VPTTPGRSRLSAAISGRLLIIILSAAGATVADCRDGGILVGAGVFMVGRRFRRLALDRGKKLSR